MKIPSVQELNTKAQKIIEVYEVMNEAFLKLPHSVLKVGETKATVIVPSPESEEEFKKRHLEIVIMAGLQDMFVRGYNQLKSELKELELSAPQIKEWKGEISLGRIYPIYFKRNENSNIESKLYTTDLAPSDSQILKDLFGIEFKKVYKWWRGDPFNYDGFSKDEVLPNKTIQNNNWVVKYKRRDVLEEFEHEQVFHGLTPPTNERIESWMKENFPLEQPTWEITWKDENLIKLKQGRKSWIVKFYVKGTNEFIMEETFFDEYPTNEKIKQFINEKIPIPYEEVVSTFEIQDWKVEYVLTKGQAKNNKFFIQHDEPTLEQIELYFINNYGPASVYSFQRMWKDKKQLTLIERKK